LEGILHSEQKVWWPKL